MGQANLEIKNYERASECFEKVLEFAMLEGNKKNEMEILDLLAQAYYKSNELEKAELNYKKSLDIAQKTNNKMQTAKNLEDIGKVKLLSVVNYTFSRDDLTNKQSVTEFSTNKKFRFRFDGFKGSRESRVNQIFEWNPDMQEFMYISRRGKYQINIVLRSSPNPLRPPNKLGLVKRCHLSTQKFRTIFM
ncbi:MAG: tetratricopeptide repeat protein [Nitrospinae bacterium]|nr:tetratricopeptide repeat protein [Nitrospinota bacterium]